MNNHILRKNKGNSLINIVLLVLITILIALFAYEIITYLGLFESINLNVTKQNLEISNEIESSNLVNHYYFNQLDDTGKIIYKALEDNIENMKTGTYKIDFDKQFNDLLNTEGGDEKLNKSFQSAWNAFTYDYMDVFYIDVSKLILTTKTTTFAGVSIHKVYLSNEENDNYLNSNIASTEELQDKISYMSNIRQTIVKQLQGYSDYDKIKYLHNWIVDNFEYDTEFETEDIYNIYGAFSNRKAVCEGYARAYKYILDGLGIESVLVTGEAINSTGQTESHAWNYVKLERKVVCYRYNMG